MNEDNMNKVNNIDNEHISSSMALDDEQRVKVLSPSMLVFKRFIRNRLAIVGVVIIVAMFLFSFAGAVLSPYSESQVFTQYGYMTKDYAGVTQNKEYRYTTVDGTAFSSVAAASFIYAINSNDNTFESQGKGYLISELGSEFYQISKLNRFATALDNFGSYTISSVKGDTLESGFVAAFRNALVDGSESFEYAGTHYTIEREKKTYYASVDEEIAIASKRIFDAASQGTSFDYSFKRAAELALINNDASFTAGGTTYELQVDDDGVASVYLNGQHYANISYFVVQAIAPDVFLTLDFKDAVSSAISDNRSSVTIDDTTYVIARDNFQWLVKMDTVTELIQIYNSPSSEHWLGTDGNGMDLLTRIMYGGKISLLIGFVVVIIETFIGTVLGGVAGYFGKWVDNLIMRIVDIFNCIPYLPLIIILGAIMDELRVDPKIRIFYLMIVLGVLGWPAIARVVRGQILSLREQEFMTAAEATGISVYRRIFKHLVPNVIPQLIVIATMNLGSIIITEATLSFLGLGVKFPYASWGSIMNAVTSNYVLQNYWFVWIPAGFCVLITVLGFNFIGDGLRDAFDPRMKR